MGIENIAETLLEYCSKLEQDLKNEKAEHNLTKNELESFKSKYYAIVEYFNGNTFTR